MENIFNFGQEGSKSKFVETMESLRLQGSDVLNVLESARLNTLVEFDRRLQSINARRIRAWRVSSPNQAVKFVISDFTDIDQANTTGTIRADSASVSLKERAVPAEAVIRTNKFSSNKGTIEALDSAQTILRIHTDDGSTPTGQFDIELTSPLTLNQFIIDIIASPSQPTIKVSISRDSITYVSATRVAINGYRVNVWLESMETRFIRIQVTPSHPDDLNGSAWTFGITNFSAQTTDYNLRSELLTKTIQFVADSENVVFNAVDDANIQYYLSIYPDGSSVTSFVEINPGDLIKIGTKVSNTVTTNNSFPYFLGSVPSDLYLNSLSVRENDIDVRIAHGLSPTDINLVKMLHEYVVLVPTSAGYDITLLNANGSYSPPRTFDISYTYGPSKVNVRLKIRLSTDDKANSPIFHGATLDEL